MLVFERFSIQKSSVIYDRRCVKLSLLSRIFKSPLRSFKCVYELDLLPKFINSIIRFVLHVAFVINFTTFVQIFQIPNFLCF